MTCRWVPYLLLILLSMESLTSCWSHFSNNFDKFLNLNISINSTSIPANGTDYECCECALSIDILKFDRDWVDHEIGAKFGIKFRNFYRWTKSTFDADLWQASNNNLWLYRPYSSSIWCGQQVTAFLVANLIINSCEIIFQTSLKRVSPLKYPDFKNLYKILEHWY